MNQSLKIIECPRDAMQGVKKFIPTNQKVQYINSLMQVGFDIIDFGSFVSHKYVPQMKDTAKVVSLLKMREGTELLSIVLNNRGALDASAFDEIKIIGYPFSISEIFQKNNSNKTREASLSILNEIQNTCIQKNKTMLVYLSMSFGNPYGEKWSKDVVFEYLHKIQQSGIKFISLADTIGNSNAESISDLYHASATIFPELDIGLHLHSSPKEVYQKLQAAWDSGCRRIDVAIGGYGGCPFAQDQLIGNIPTNMLLNFLNKNNITHSLDLLAFENACNQSKKVFC